MRPTPRAEQLGQSVQQALHLVEQALLEAEVFDPGRSHKTFRLHMSDIGEGVFLPGLMHAVRRLAPNVRIETQQLDFAQIEDALDAGRLDLALSYLPGVDGTERQPLLDERYVALLRADHPLADAAATRDGLHELDYVLVRQHTQTARLLQQLGLQDKVRLSIPHFMVIPGIIAETDLAVILPRRTALGFARRGRFRLVEPDLGQPGFTVALHWCRRYRNDPARRWLRELIIERFCEFPGPGRKAAAPPEP
jgi:DNA-binding transcriptional LysR family regulator